MKYLKLIILICFSIIIFCTCSKSFKKQSLKLRYHKGQLYYSTSELNNPTQYTLGEYGAHNLFDRDENTCWAEGKSNEGIGETIYWKINENVKYFFMINGFAKSDSLFKKNNRIKKIKISVYIGANKPGHATEIYTIYDSIKYPKYKSIVLKDTMNPQKINFPFHWENLKKFREKVKNLMDKNLKLEYFLGFEIKNVYKGLKYNDTCLSDIWLKKASENIEKIKN